MAVEIFLASRGEGIPYPKEEVEVEVVEASFVVVVVGWIAVEVAVAESEYCTGLSWGHLISWLRVRFRVARKIVLQRFPRANCFGLTGLQWEFHPIALAVAVPEHSGLPRGLERGAVERK